MTIDLVPTFAELSGGDVSSWGLPGESFAAVLTDGVPKSRLEPLFWELKETRTHFDDPEGVWHTFAVLQDGWKLVHQNQTTQLYDLVVDPGEADDLAEEFPDTVTLLLEEHRQWRLSQGLIPHQVRAIRGDVVIEGDTYTFDGGVALLEEETRLSVLGFMDLSVALRLSPDTAGSRRTVVGTVDTWEVGLSALNQVVAKLHDDVGNTTRLTSQTVLLPGLEHQVVLTLMGWLESNQTVRLYVDGNLEDETNEIVTGPTQEHPVAVGARHDQQAPFLGTVRDLQFYSISLTQDEVAEVLGE